MAGGSTIYRMMGSSSSSGKWNMEVGVLLGVVVLMVVMVTVVEGVGIVVVGSVQRE